MPDSYEQLAAHFERIRQENASAKDRECQELREQRDELLAAIRTVLDTFVKDESQGYHSRDRQYAVTILGAAIAKAEGK